MAAGAYYVGAVVGLELRLLPTTPSILWPPNAILTVLLLFVPPVRWGFVLAGAAVAHFAAEIGTWSAGVVAALFVSNCLEALLAAVLIRLLNDRPCRLDTLRQMGVFIVMGGFIAPFVTSFVDAGVVRLLLGDEYWTVWRLRLLSNTLAQLSIVPAVAGLLNADPLRQWPRRRWMAAVAIAGGLLLVAFAVSNDAGGIGLSRAPLAPFIPVLLLAAVRFGPTGVSLAVLATTLLVVESTAVGQGLLRAVAPADQRSLLQLFLIASIVPLLCVAALVDERQEAVEAVKASDGLKSSILGSIPSLVAVVSRDWRILAVNENWLRFVRREVPPGTPYLEEWAGLTDRRSGYARAAYDGVKGVLEGATSGFTLEYPSEFGGSELWWFMSAVPLRGPEGGAVITHTDITARKRAEHEVQRSRDELAHGARVWVMGELTASLSHQLNQPLTGIVGNAHAGRRFLDADPPNLVEIRHILADIIFDAERAAEVTKAVRDMLRKDTRDYELLSMNDVVRDVAALIRSEAAIRDVSLKLRLVPSLPLIRGDRVQLRQVMLNLIMNAMDAVAGCSEAARRAVAVTTEAAGVYGVQVSVLDTGGGLPPGAEEQVFEPLFTTKPSGMGMGLPIAKAIAEAHGGTLRGANAAPGGAVFHLTLPFSPASPGARGSAVA
jgi:two-component system, LuxR family, sensor kinase FixL